MPPPRHPPATTTSHRCTAPAHCTPVGHHHTTPPHRTTSSWPRGPALGGHKSWPALAPGATREAPCIEMREMWEEKIRRNEGEWEVEGERGWGDWDFPRTHAGRLPPLPAIVPRHFPARYKCGHICSGWNLALVQMWQHICAGWGYAPIQMWPHGGALGTLTLHPLQMPSFVTGPKYPVQMKNWPRDKCSIL
jgi:hypothetical protein